MPGVVRNTDGYHHTYELTPALEKWMKETRARTKGKQKAPKPDDSIENIFPAMNRMVVMLGKIEREDLDEMEGDELVEYFADLMPVIERAGVIAQRIIDTDDQDRINELGVILRDTPFIAVDSSRLK